MSNQTKILNSSLWSAYGDALGFISELTDDYGLKRRLHGKSLEDTVSWQKLIGGRFGALITLPAGCYSDDTQLRIAVCRCIRSDGEFDVEAFAKIELPVWQCYALGAGRSTRAAAASLSGRNVTWFSNFFQRKDLTYIRSGGNGAAMRVQPHIWGSSNLEDPAVYLRDVIRNSICTHGHPRGFLGAAFHSMCLAHVMRSGHLPPPSAWVDLVKQLDEVNAVILNDPDLRSFWLPTWERAVGYSLGQEIKKVQGEMTSDLSQILQSRILEGSGDYRGAVKSLGAFEDAQRGSGTKTAILSLVLAWIFRQDHPKRALLASARLLGSDTDTIGTTTGALLGALSESEPDGALLDRAYIKEEATRLANISIGNPVRSFRYPDLLTWKPPKNALECVGLVKDRPCIVGLGFLFFENGLHKGNEKQDQSGWQWAKLDFGQTVLCKRRDRLMPLPENSLREPQMSLSIPNKDLSSEKLAEVSSQANSSTSKKDMGSHFIKPSSIDELTTEAIKSNFDPSVIGEHFLQIAERDSPIELAIAYAAVIVKARRARMKRG